MSAFHKSDRLLASLRTMKIFLTLALVVLAAAGIYFLWPLPPLESIPRPTVDYTDAVARFAAIEKSEATLPLAPEGRSRVLLHGSRTPHVFVLLHGLTNAPGQFSAMAKILFDSGANVVIPRARYAGFADRLNTAQGGQNAQDLLDQAAMGLDIAAGLGDRVTLVGLSGSSVAAAWMAQNRDGIDSVVLLAPFFGVHGLPVPVGDALASILARLPTVLVWWNPELREANPGPPLAYPRFGTVTMADTLRLSRNVRDHLISRPLMTRNLSIVISGADTAINNELARSLAASWIKQAPENVTLFEFPASEGVPHDMIDPAQPDAKIHISYSKILALPGMMEPQP